VTTRTASTITITWTASGVIDRFEITYNYTVIGCVGTGGPITVSVPGGSHTLMDLNGNSRYTITVRAINTAGSTMATTSVDFLTSGNADYVIVMCMH
jgi:hypothetical protein